MAYMGFEIKHYIDCPFFYCNVDEERQVSVFLLPLLFFTKKIFSLLELILIYVFYAISKLYKHETKTSIFKFLMIL